MMPKISADYRGEKTRSTIVAGRDDLQWLQDTARDAGSNLSASIHLLIELMRMRVAQAKQAGAVPESGNEIEMFLLLTAKDAGALNDNDFAHLLWLSEHVGESMGDRLDTILSVINAGLGDEVG